MFGNICISCTPHVLRAPEHCASGTPEKTSLKTPRNVNSANMYAKSHSQSLNGSPGNQLFQKAARSAGFKPSLLALNLFVSLSCWCTSAVRGQKIPISTVFMTFFIFARDRAALCPAVQVWTYFAKGSLAVDCWRNFGEWEPPLPLHLSPSAFSLAYLHRTRQTPGPLKAPLELQSLVVLAGSRAPSLPCWCPKFVL